MSLKTRMEKASPVGKMTSSLLDEIITKVNSILTKMNLGNQHLVNDVTNTPGALDVTDLAALYVVANDLKAKYNAHIASTTHHLSADSTNGISATDATTQGSLDTLLNEMKTDISAHFRIQVPHITIEPDISLVITSTDSSDLPTAQVLATEIHTKYSDHLLNTDEAFDVLLSMSERPNY